jgi:hypothetical protein
VCLAPHANDFAILNGKKFSENTEYVTLTVPYLAPEFSYWPNSALNSSEIPVQGSSAMRLTADIVRQQVRMAANDP